MEVWKSVEKGYEVSNLGRVRSFWNNRWGLRGIARIMRPWIADRTGHVSVTLRERGTVFVHHLVLEAFVGPCPEGLECRHLNGKPADNRLENLAWGTSRANKNDRRDHGTGNVGYQNPSAQHVTPEIVALIKERLKTRRHGDIQKLARELKLGRNTISRIANGRHHDHD